MGLLNVFKKNSVPEELPKLVSDEIEEKEQTFIQIPKLENQIIKKIEAKTYGEPIKEEIKQESKENIIEEKFNTDFGRSQESEIDIIKKEIEKEQEDINERERKEREKVYIENTKLVPKYYKNTLKENVTEEKSFFKELEEDLNLEIEDLDKLEDWYKNKFLPRDVVYDMKKHWENKKNNAVIRVLGRNFQTRINEKTEKLQKLEKEWQNTYFDLIEKEEEIREEEQELKKMLEEFVELCKRKTNENEKEEE